MKILHSVHPADFESYNTSRIRERFLLNDLYVSGKINFTYTLYDRMMIGIASPGKDQIHLPNYSELRASYFLERREMGIINVAEAAGDIIVDGKTYTLNKLDCLYIGKGVKEVIFKQGENSSYQPLYYILSCPAHASFPTTLLTYHEASKVNAGSSTMANKRTINKYIHTEGIKSCQLVMGLTILEEGNVWNTMPPHVHERRMEAYFYFDLPKDQTVFHYMGTPSETRHIVVKNYEAIVSPTWSIHSGSGTSAYSFIWGMAGENLDYTDMDGVEISNLK